MKMQQSDNHNVNYFIEELNKNKKAVLGEINSTIIAQIILAILLFVSYLYIEKSMILVGFGLFLLLKSILNIYQIIKVKKNIRNNTIYIPKVMFSYLVSDELVELLKKIVNDQNKESLIKENKKYTFKIIKKQISMLNMV